MNPAAHIPKERACAQHETPVLSAKPLSCVYMGGVTTRRALCGCCELASAGIPRSARFLYSNYLGDDQSNAGDGSEQEGSDDESWLEELKT